MTARRNTKTETKAPEAEAEVTPEAGTISVKDLCAELNAEPKAFRRWLRTQTNDRAGRGGRWHFTPETAELLKDRYAKRSEAKATEPTLSED